MKGLERMREMRCIDEIYAPTPRSRWAGRVIAMAMMLAAMAAHAADSAPFLLDTVTTSSTQTVDSVSVSWDASWIGGDTNATVVIADNGTEVKRTTGVGEFVYVPSLGLHELTYTTYIGGVAQDEVYTATLGAVKAIRAAMVGAVADVVYTGSAHRPEPEVTDTERGVTLVNGTDYTLSWGENTVAGSGSVTVTGKGNYIGTITRNFTIAKAEVSPPTVASKAYTGALLTADVSATTYYTVQNNGGVNVGSYPVTLTLTDAANYRWKDGDSNPFNLTFSITKAENSWTTQPSIAGWTYGQAANAPNLGAAQFGNVQVSYSATPQNAGSYTATFTVPETANYAGLSKAVPFTIAKATYNMDNARWSAGSFTYDGTQKSVIVEGLPSGVTVLSYANNAKTAAGNYTATATLNYDTTNFNAPSIDPCSWSIARKNIAGATVTLGPTLVYNGTEQTQAVTGVKVDGLDATYTVSGNKGTDAGTYTLTVTGTGNFTGTATKQWQIRPDGIIDAVTSYDGIYDGEGHGIEVSVTKPSSGAAVKCSLDAGGPYAEDAILFTNVTEGAVAVWYTVEAENYASVTNFGTVKISPKTLTEAMVTVEDVNYTYDGTAKTPTVTVADGNPSIVTEDDYNLAYSDNIAAGTDTATVTVTGKGNYTGTVTKHFTIDKAEVTPPASVASKPYTGALLTADVSATTRYTVQNNGGVNVGGYPVVLTLTDVTNYRWKDGDSNPLNLAFSITKAENSWTMQPLITGWTYGQAANAPNLGVAKFGAASVAYSATPQNAGSYTATFTVPETANYAGLTKVVPFTIAKATYDMTGAKWDYAGEFKYDGSVKTVLVSGLPIGVSVSAYSGNSASAPGTYTAHAALGYDAVNFNAPSIADLNWSIKSSEGSKLEDIFEDLPADVEPDGEGGWTVTITNDIDSADLPIEIPDNLGHVTIDLKGHDLIGTDGANGDNVTPGGDGKSAIRVVAGDGGGGTVTRLTIITTGGDALVKGGDGGAGNPGGNGAAAIKVVDGARGGVKIDIGDGVTVRGGKGGNSTTGKGGDGGSGIEGDVGTNDGTIIGGDGGDSESGNGGNGGHGVDGNVDDNNGSITGGDGGDSDHGRAGDGGQGATGDVGTNDGTISGGKGGETTDGTPGDDGKPVGGTIGGGSGTVVKVKLAVPEVPSAEYTGEAVEPQVPSSALYAVSASAWTRPGSYPVVMTLLDAANYEWVPRDGATVNGLLAIVNFVIVEPLPHIETEGGEKSGRENAASVVATYDGAGHGITVKVTYPPTGARIRYACDEKGPFTDEKPLFTNAVDAAETWYELSANGFDPVTNMATVTIAPRSLATAALGSLRFEDMGGVRTPVPTLVDDLGYDVPPADYMFTWEEEASGAMTLSFAGRGNYLGLFETRLAQTRFHVSFDANGGEVDSEGADYDIGTYYGELPVPSKAGYLFDGWYEKADFSGKPVTRNTQVIAQDLTLHAKWLRRALWYTDAVFHLEGAATYDGYVLDPAAGDRVVGTISVKAGKPNKTMGTSKLTVVLQIAGQKKVTVKGTTYDGTLRDEGSSLDLRLGVSSLTGTFGRYALDGSRNVFVAKDADSAVVAAQALKQWQGTYIAAWEGTSGWNGISIDVKSKGKAKVSGTLADGTKVSANSQLLVGERECALAVSWTKKAASVACLVWFCEDGTVECMNADGAETLIANARDGAMLPSGAALRIDATAMSAVVPGLLTELLPDGVEVRMKGLKFDIDKAGKVSAKGGTMDLTKAGTNPAGLKLSYKIKDCTFKGAFSAYVLSGGKLTKVKVQVSGVVLRGKGYGTATVKGKGAVAITIE